MPGQQRLRPGQTGTGAVETVRPGLPAGADVVRAHALRVGAEITEIEGSHVIMISRPQAVADVIEATLARVG